MSGDYQNWNNDPPESKNSPFKPPSREEWDAFAKRQKRARRRDKGFWVVMFIIGALTLYLVERWIVKG